MKTNPRSLHVPVLLLAAASLVLGQAADGAVLVSNEFSFGYGANTANTVTWTSNGGTSPTDGDFTFTPVLSGHHSSAHGPSFESRVLTTTTGGNPYSGSGNGFGVTINASWGGDAATELPGVDPAEVGIRLVITEIRIYALYYAAVPLPGDASTRFLETTPGDTQSSNPVTIGKYTTSLTNLRNATHYTDVSWDPNDHWVLGTSASRTFSLETLVGGEPGSSIVDGFEVFGYIEVTQIPEPLTTSILSIGAGVWVLNARRKRHLRA